MTRIPALAVVLLCANAAAQYDARSRLLPITSEIHRAGVYHVATGAWTRGASLANFGAPQVIYNNTCTPVYFMSLITNERFQHRSRIPSPSGPVTDSIFYGATNPAHRWDARPGSCESYLIDGFQVGYCSSHVGAFDWQYGFSSSYTSCNDAAMIPQYAITVTGLPGGTSTGGQHCWTIDIDVSGLPGGGFVLSADGDGSYDGPSTVDQFGFSFGPAGPMPGLAFTGPLIAGNFTWTGGPGTVSGPLTPCTGTDGTIWDGPIDLAEAGTGMGSNDFYRVDPVKWGSDPHCYYFGGNPHADFYLKLFSSPQCADHIHFCAPGVGGIVTCPCGNPQVPAGATKGCNNFAGGGSGGAIFDHFGAAILSADSLGFTLTGGVGSAVTILFQGTTNTANTRSGAGVRCVSGILKRLYKGNELAGAITFPDSSTSVHDASAAKGFPILPPVTLYYYSAYRNSAANGHPGCPGLDFGFNTSNADAVGWVP